MADFNARANDLKSRHSEIAQEISDYRDQGVDEEDTDVMRRVQTIRSISAQMKNEVQEMIEFFHTRKDQLDFDPGNVNIDAAHDRGDPRRPNLNG